MTNKTNNKTKIKPEKIIVGDNTNQTKRRKIDLLNEFVNKNFNTIVTIMFFYIIVTTIVIISFFFSLQFIMYRSQVEKDRIYSDFKEYNKILLNKKDLKTVSDKKEVYQRNVITIMEKYKTNLTIAEVTELSSYIFDTYESLQWSNPYLPISFMYVESKFNRNAVGGVGEKGLFQILPSTGKMLAKSLGIEYYNDIEFNHMIAIKMWFEYIKNLNETFDGNINLVCLAYNAGPENVIKYCKIKVNRETGSLDLSSYDIKNIKKLIYYDKNRKVAYDDQILRFLDYMNKEFIDE